MRSTLFLYVTLGLLAGYVFLSGSISHPLHAKALKENGSAFEAVTGESADDDQTAWDSFYKQKAFLYGKEPVSFLKDHIDLIPTGKAFVPAMGEGQNAIFLAKKGFKVEGNDLSEVAIDKALAEAKNQHVTIKATISDLRKFHFPKNEYDLVVVAQFYSKPLNHHLKESLKSGGYILFYNLVKSTDPHEKKMSPDDFTVKPSELKEQFKDFHMKLFQEYEDNGLKVVGMLARKP